jgi:hypothetical protein
MRDETSESSNPTSLPLLVPPGMPGLMIVNEGELESMGGALVSRRRCASAYADAAAGTEGACDGMVRMRAFAPRERERSASCGRSGGSGRYRSGRRPDRRQHLSQIRQRPYTPQGM